MSNWRQLLGEQVASLVVRLCGALEAGASIVSKANFGFPLGELTGEKQTVPLCGQVSGFVFRKYLLTRAELYFRGERWGGEADHGLGPYLKKGMLIILIPSSLLALTLI